MKRAFPFGIIVQQSDVENVQELLGIYNSVYAIGRMDGQPCFWVHEKTLAIATIMITHGRLIDLSDGS
jgi:hypothetical protein